MRHYNNIRFALLILLASQNIFAQTLTPEEIYDKVKESVVIINVYDQFGNKTGFASGVAGIEAGLILTNYHVFTGGNQLEIIQDEKSTKDYKIIGADSEKDILILKVDSTLFVPLKTYNSELRVGNKVYAIGNPSGFNFTMSDGIISGLKRKIDFDDNLIQITAPISHGSSGGALVNNHGELIGITKSSISNEKAQNINFAIPVTEFQNIEICLLDDEECIEFFDTYVSAYNAMSSGRYESASSILSAYLENNKFKIKANRLFAKILMLKGFVEEDESLLQQALSIDPDIPNGRLDLASFVFSKGEINRASQLFQIVIYREPGNANAFSYLARCFGARGNRDAEIHYHFIAYRKGSKFSREYLIKEKYLME